ncbi:heme/hemopexin utilization protein C precursor [Roseovarius sp. A-2]|uniref:TonB-dependent receptor domain-containing protein n=1 Tax=Roseovarius sp. A-2 TaxID=1570360 RepID=UPI0009B4FD87|nr:TonB-dependent receptor [Roseovarius sp. A-2]GAW34274.1 heme/hemopexin utilization protein C precursor [Roseovarius sp. A-2]
MVFIKHWRNGSGLGLGCVLAVHAGFASAQEGEAAAQDTFRLPDIVIFGAARDERALLDTPNAASVVGEEEIRRRQPSTYAEMLDDVPGLSIEGGPRGVSQEINIRGFQDEQVVLRLDGGRQNFNLAHRGRFFTDPMILKQVEVLRGGASTLFGSGALGGVVFTDTKDARDVIDPGKTVGGEVSTGYNSNGNEWKYGATGAVQHGAFDALIFLSGRDRGSDIEDGSGADIVDSQIDSENYLLKFGVEPADGLRFETSYQRYEDDGVTPPNTNVQGTPTTSVNRELTHEAVRAGVEWNPAGNPLVNANALFFYNNTEVREDRIFDGRFDTTDFETVGFEITNISEFDIGVPVALSYGFEVFEDRQTGTRDGAPRAQTPDAKQQFYAAFAQADFTVTPTLTLTAGLRYDVIDTKPEGGFASRSDEEFSPKLALSWRPTENTQVFASASRSFRAASLTEMFPQGVHFIAGPGFPLGGPGSPFFTGVNEFLPTPTLRPETADQIEIGMRHRIDGLFWRGDRLDLSGNIYYAEVDDFIDTVVTFIDPATTGFNPVTGRLEVAGSTTSRNIDARLYGLELSADYDAQSWFGGASLSVPRGERRGGAGELGSIPQDRLVLTGGLRPAPGWELGARATFLRKLDAGDLPAGTQPVAAAEVFDVFASWQPQRGMLEGTLISAGVDNVFDENYRIHPNGLNNPGVTAKLTISRRF